MSIRLEENELTLRLFLDEESAKAYPGVTTTLHYRIGWIAKNADGRWIDVDGVLPETWQPDTSSMSGNRIAKDWGLPVANVTPPMPKVATPKQQANPGMDAKGLARSLRTQLGTLGLEVTHAQALELLAKTAGLADWNTLAAKAGRSVSVAASAPVEEPSLVAVPKTGFFCPKCGEQGTVRSTVTAFVEQGEYTGDQYQFEGDADHWCCDACGHQFLDWQSDWPALCNETGYLVLLVTRALSEARALLVPVKEALAAISRYGAQCTGGQYQHAKTGAELAAVVNREVETGDDNSDLVEALEMADGGGIHGTIAGYAYEAAALPADAVKLLLSKLPAEVALAVENPSICGQWKPGK